MPKLHPFMASWKGYFPFSLTKTQHAPFLSKNFMALSFNSQTHSFCYIACPGNNSRKSQSYHSLFILKAILFTYKAFKRTQVAPQPSHHLCTLYECAVSPRVILTAFVPRGKYGPGVTVFCVISKGFPFCAWRWNKTLFPGPSSWGLPGQRATWHEPHTRTGSVLVPCLEPHPP